MTTAVASKRSQLHPLKDVNPEDVLERYLAEESGADIAKTYGVTRAALSYFMLKHAEDQWKSAQLVKALMRKDEADSKIENAKDALELGKAREMLRSAQWDLERVCRRVYGQDSPTQSSSVQININLSRRDASALDSRTRQSVQPQQYDSEAAHNAAVIDAEAVDSSAKS